MKLKNIVLVVKNVEASYKFYHELFGLQKTLDNDGNMMLTEGIVLQEKNIWEESLNQKVAPHNNSFELYFETNNLDDFVEKLEEVHPNVHFATPITKNSWDRKIIRFYDLDGHLIEVAATNSNLN